MTQEPVVASRGVVRQAEIPPLANHGTSYALFNEWIADHECALTTDTYRLGDCVGERVGLRIAGRRHRGNARDERRPPGIAEDEADALMKGSYR